MKKDMWTGGGEEQGRRKVLRGKAMRREETDTKMRHERQM